jgi:hypothetical protein
MAEGAIKCKSAESAESANWHTQGPRAYWTRFKPTAHDAPLMIDAVGQRDEVIGRWITSTSRAKASALRGSQLGACNRQQSGMKVAVFMASPAPANPAPGGP